MLQATLVMNKLFSVENQGKIISSLIVSREQHSTGHTVGWHALYSWGETILNALWTLRIKSQGQFLVLSNWGTV